MSTLTLFTRPDCHLCEDAKEILAEVAPQTRLREVDIEDDLALIQAYGVRIPVFRKENGAELGWPFDADALSGFLAG